VQRAGPRAPLIVQIKDFLAVVKRRPLATALTTLLAVAFCYFGGWVYFGVCGHSGTATNKQALLQVYKAADPHLAEVAGNSFLHKLQFTAPIQWHRAVWRPYVSATSRLDVVRFQHNMRDEPFVYFYPDRNFTVYYFQILHRLKDDCVVMTEGTLDMTSGAFGMWSTTLESKTDDHSWHRLTNRAPIEFPLNTPDKL